MSHQVYPTRSFIRFMAKSQLTADLAGHAVPAYVSRSGAIDETLDFQPAEDGSGAYCDVFRASGDCLDEALLQRITAAMLDPEQSPKLFRPYASEAEAAKVEAAAAEAIVAAYKQACLEQRQQLVDQFNQLLDR
ncbi:hypothetical protein C7293_02865 [filamentous cyanobacterium CCT1]|nr:hypothetical protein C7293_02865 [filamentous cyanobacterium CCT1]PSN80119.1 hypothetical protein C8B47_08085 [filamentous cyanobacterium CCP4]